MPPHLKSIAIPILLAALAALLIFPNLTRSLLWQDEAQTALLARTTLRHGIPVGYDGANSLSQEEGRDIDSRGVFRYHPWSQFYIAAASFALFGESTFTARLPFALFGIATSVLTYFVARSLWRNEAAAMAAALFLTFSVPFLLLVRQCRYFSPLAFFLLLAVFAYFQILRGRSRYIALFAVAAVATMHTFHLYALVFLATASLHTLVWHRYRWKAVLLPSAVIVLVHVPWFLWVLAVAQYDRPHTGAKMLDHCVAFSMQSLWHIVTPPTILAYVLLRRAARYSDDSRAVFDPDQRSAAIFLAMLFVVSVVSVAFSAPWVFFRYLSPLPPLAALLFGPTIPFLVSRRHKWSAAIVAVTVVAWLLTAGALRDYRYELVAPYRGPIRGIVEYLNANAKPDDVVLIPYGDMPLKFYTNLRIVGGLTGEDLEQARGARFLVAREKLPSPQSATVDRFLVSIADPREYELVVLDYPDFPFETREDLANHYFNQDWIARPVSIFKRRDK